MKTIKIKWRNELFSRAQTVIIQFDELHDESSMWDFAWQRAYALGYRIPKKWDFWRWLERNPYDKISPKKQD